MKEILTYLSGLSQLIFFLVGVWKRLKDVIPNLIDNGGDTAHIVNNASKVFTKEFGEEIEKLVDKIHVDMLEVGQRNAYEKLAAAFGVKTKRYQRRLDHRWLSLLPCLVHIMDELDVLTVFYSAFSQEDTEHEAVGEIIDKYLNDDGKSNVKTLLSKIRCQYKKKWGSQQAQSSKMRRLAIVDQLLTHRYEFLLAVEFLMEHLSTLNDFVKLLQHDAPLIHKMLPEMKNLVRRLAASFLKPESMEVISAAVVKDRSNCLPSRKLLEHFPSVKLCGNAAKDSLARKAKNGLMACAAYLCENLPYNLPVWSAFMGLDPEKRRTETSVKKLMDLANIFSGYHHANLVKLNAEIRLYAADDEIPSHVDSSGNLLGLDRFWCSVFNLKNALSEPKYHELQKLILPALTCFNGPKVENAFTLMNMTMTEFRPSLTVSSMSACLSAQYRKKLFGDSVTQLLPKSKDPACSTVNPVLLAAMKAAWRLRLEDRRAKKVVREADEHLSEAGKEMREKEASARKSKIQERKRKLAELVPSYQRRADALRNLPPIPKLKRKLSVAATSAAADDDIDDVEEEASIEDVDVAPPPAKRHFPSTKAKQTDIMSFFSKKHE